MNVTLYNLMSCAYPVTVHCVFICDIFCLRVLYYDCILIMTVTYIISETAHSLKVYEYNTWLYTYNLIYMQLKRQTIWSPGYYQSVNGLMATHAFGHTM